MSSYDTNLDKNKANHIPLTPLTFLEQLQKNYNLKNISVLKGPCLAKELARKNQTSVIIANKNINIAKSIGRDRKSVV